MYATYLMSTGKTHEALAEMKLAVELDPFSPMMKLYLAFSLQSCGESDEAIRICEAVLDADPHFRAALETLGWIRLGQGRIEEATEAFEALYRMLGDPLKGVSDLGYVYAIQGRTEEAREMLSRLEQRRERDPDVVLGIDFATVLAGLGEVEEAAAHLRDARDQHMAAVLMLPNHPPWDGLIDHPAVADVYREIGRPL
jgi:tetratricopeptide (TPR) repeat protein